MRGVRPEDADPAAWVRRHGYEIRRTDDGVEFIDRGTWGLTYAMTSVAGICTALGIGGVAVWVTSDGRGHGAEAAILLGLAALGGGVLARLWSAYVRRRDRPSDEVGDRLFLSAREASLKDEQGRHLAQLQDVHTHVTRDWFWSRGVLSMLWLQWPMGRRVVLRAGRSPSEAIAERLESLGVRRA